VKVDFSARTSSDPGKARTATDFELAGPDNPINRNGHRIQADLTAIGQALTGSPTLIGGLVDVGVSTRPASKEPVLASKWLRRDTIAVIPRTAERNDDGLSAAALGA
jgi:hypothetical protein